MKLARIAGLILAIGLIAGMPSPVRGEEITLKDGQKIVGTIIGYENDMFRVETDFGIALIRKDKVVSIQVNTPTSSSAKQRSASYPNPDSGLTTKNAQISEKSAANSPPKSQAPVSNSSPPKSPPEPAKILIPAPIAAKPLAPATASTQTILPPPVTVNSPPPAPVAAKPIVAQPAPSKPVATVPPEAVVPPPPPVSHPIDAPLPAHIQEHVDGNTYFNDTFQFSMYKPPDWKIFEGVPKETGSGIMAMGTEDEQTLLIVDRQVWSGAPRLAGDEVEANLRQTYQEYHRISEENFPCDGQAATRRTFTGMLDGVEWHGVAVHVIHGNVVFGIIGLTSAETFQFQEAIFNKIVKTLHFQTPPATASASPIP